MGQAVIDDWAFDPATMERRAVERRPIGNVVAMVDLGDGRDPVNCCLWDCSDQGACILIPPDVELPQHFKLHVSDTWRAAAIVWRRWSHVGVQFLDAATDRTCGSG